MRYAHLAPDHLKSADARIDFGTNPAQTSKTTQKDT